MKLTCVLSPERATAFLAFRETPAPDDWVAAALELVTRRGFPANYRVLIDFRRVPPLELGVIQQLAAWMGDCHARGPGARWALVAGHGASYGAIREVALLASARDGVEVEAFATPAMAVCWLRGELEPVPMPMAIRPRVASVERFDHRPMI